MANLMTNVEAQLANAKFSGDQIAKVKEAIRDNLPPKTYNMAVLFLGLVTIVLAVGSLVLAGLGQTVADALWGALGAGIGGLAGIFMTRE